MGEYGLKFYMSIHMSLLLSFHSVDMMLGANKANRANDQSMERCNLLYVTWVGEIFHELGLSTLGMNHFILCISCIEENYGHHATWRFTDEEGYLNFQLEAILDILERQLWSWACITNYRRWGGLPYEDAIWREMDCCSIHFCSYLRRSNILARRTVIFPIFHQLIGILDF